MVTPISVSITAVDTATKVFQQMNANIERMQAPVKNLQRSFDRFAQLSGINRLNEGFSRIRASATSAFRVMGQIAPVLGTITSVATVAGVARLSTNWANFGSNLQTTSQRLGMSVSGLHSWQNGARLAGVSAQSMTSAMGNLQENIWNAKGGRNPQFVTTLNAMHVAMSNVDGSARPMQAIMDDVANVIAKMKNPIAQATLATAAFGSAGNEILPFLREGAGGMARYRQETLKYGVMNEAGAKAANRLREAQARLTQSVEGFGNSLAQSIEPVLNPIIENMANWTAVNKDWISQNVTDYVQQFSTYLKSINWQQVSTGAQQVWNSVKQFTQTIQENIDKLGGLKTILGVVAAVMGMKVVGSVMSMIAPFASLAMTIGRVVVPAALSLVAAMGPVGWAIMATGIIVGAAAVYIYKHWDTFKPYFKKLWSGVKSIFDIYVKAIQVILKPFIGLFSIIQKDWEPLTNFFSGMLDGIKEYFYNAFKYIGDIIGKITSAVDKVGNALGLTKKQAEDVSNTMKIQSPSSVLYTPSVANDNAGPSQAKGSSMFGGWFSGGDKAKPKTNAKKQFDRMTGQVGNFFTTLQNTVNEAASRTANIPSVPPATTQLGAAVSNVTPIPVAQQAQQTAQQLASTNVPLNKLIAQSLTGTDVSMAQAQALAMTESSGRWQGNSQSSAVGYMQILDGTAKHLGIDRYDPAQNVKGGIEYYNQMLKKVKGNQIAAYGAYHDGPGSKGVIRFLKSGGQDLSGFSNNAQQGMLRFQKYLAQAQTGQLQLPNAGIPQGIIPPSPTLPYQSSINKLSAANMPNMSNMGGLTPITANSGLGQLGGENVGINNGPSAPAVNLPMFENNNATPQKLFLEIDIKGKPANMDIKANSKSSNLTVEKIKYQRAMDPINSASGF